MKFKKKPITIEAEKWTGTKESFNRIKSLGLKKWKPGELGSKSFIIETLEGDMLVVKGDWVIRGISGEFYPCKNDIFKKTYLPVLTNPVRRV